MDSKVWAVSSTHLYNGTWSRWYIPLFHAIRRRKRWLWCGKFNSHFVKRTNIIYERAMFNRRIQEEGEAVDVFITALYAQAEKMIRNKIVVGIRDTGLSGPWPDITKGSYTDKRSRVSEEPAVSDSEQGQAVHKGRGPPKKQFQKQSGSKRPDQKLSCYRCGKSPLHDTQQCPAKEAECRACGHYQAVCRTKNIGKVHHEECWRS